MLSASVIAGDSGPVIVLSGEADITSAPRLSAVLASHMHDGTGQLTVDAAGLRFADSTAIRIMLQAAKTMRGRGGGLVLLRPQRPVAVVLNLTGADQLITIQGETGSAPGLDSDATAIPELPAARRGAARYDRDGRG